MKLFQDDKLYLTNDPALRVIAPYSTMAHWRSEGRGPAYIKLGAKVGYSGRALNEWLSERTIRPPLGGEPAGAAA